MDQKNKIMARLQERFGASSLPGAAGAVSVPVQAEKPAVVQAPVREIAVSGEKAERNRIATRYAHLDQDLQQQIEALIVLEQNYPIRGYLSEDLQRAGIIIGQAVRELHWPEFCRYSALFFGPAHEALCTVFKSELQAVARRYGKNSKNVPVRRTDSEQ